jgi:hypothetical protein
VGKLARAEALEASEAAPPAAPGVAEHTPDLFSGA